MNKLSDCTYPLEHGYDYVKCCDPLPRHNCLVTELSNTAVSSEVQKNIIDVVSETIMGYDGFDLSFEVVFSDTLEETVIRIFVYDGNPVKKDKTKKRAIDTISKIINNHANLSCSTQELRERKKTTIIAYKTY